MFASPQILKPLMLPESSIGHIRLAKETDLHNLMITGVTRQIEAMLPRGVVHFPHGEPETMLAEVALRRLDPDDPQAKKRNDFKDNLLVRANELTGAAQFMKLYPDRELSRYVARGGLSLSEPDEGRPAAPRAAMEQRSIGAVITSAIQKTSKLESDDVFNPEHQAGSYQVWLEHVIQTIGRRPIISEKVGAASFKIASIFNRLSSLPEESWFVKVAKGLLAMYYMHFSSKEEDLVYKSDYSSSMFTRFVSVRMRDYASFYASLYAIETAFNIRVHEENCRSLLAIIGEANAPQTTIADLQASLRVAMNGERVREASKFVGVIDAAFTEFKKAYATDHLLIPSTKDVLSIVAGFGKGEPWAAPMQLNPEYADIKIGPQMTRKHLTDEEINTARNEAMAALRASVRLANNLASTLPPLEQGSSIFDSGPMPSFSFPTVSEPRFLSVSDGGTYAVGVSAVSVDAKGVVNDELLPHMGKIFNYTKYADTKAGTLVSRLYDGVVDDVGLPASLKQLPVPINYLEGEKAIPVYLSMRDIVSDGNDYLRDLQGLLMSATLESLPFVISQLAAAFVVLVKGRVISRITSLIEAATNLAQSLTVEGVPVDVSEIPAISFAPIEGTEWTAMMILGKSRLHYNKQFVYGVPIQDVFAENLPYIKTLDKAILHPDSTTCVALIPLGILPVAKQSDAKFTYVRADVYKLVPVTELKNPASLKTWQKAHFSSTKYPVHGQYWGVVERAPEEQPLITVQQPGVLLAYRPNYVGYLSEDALVAAPSPWKAAKPPVITQEVPVPPAAPAELPVPQAEAPQGTEEKI